MSKNRDIEEGLKKLLGDPMKKGNKISNKSATLTDLIYKDLACKTISLENISNLYSAPKDWNFYQPLNKVKSTELYNSIRDNGLLTPILLWEIPKSISYGEVSDKQDIYNNEGTRFMILSGHNRAECYKQLYQKTQDTTYLKIPSIVYTEKECNINSAQNIIIDTNYVQRALSIEEKVRSIMNKYTLYSRSGEKGPIRTKISNDLQVGENTVSRYYNLGLLLPELQKLIYDRELSIERGLELSKLNQEKQTYILENYIGRLNKLKAGSLKYVMKLTEIDQVFQEDKDTTVRITITIPSKYEADFKKWFKEWEEKLD